MSITRLCLIAFSCFLFGCITEEESPVDPGIYQRMGNDSALLGELLIYHESDSTLLYYLYVTRGAPSYNSGTLTGRIKTNQKNLLLESKVNDLDCLIELLRQEDGSILLKTLQDECGFGGNVYADGIFVKKGNEQPKFFDNLEGKRTYFKDIKPTDW